MKVIVVGDSLLNPINEKGMCKRHAVKVKNVPGGTTALDEIDTLVGHKPDCIIVYADTNGITKGINTLNMVKKSEKKVKVSFTQYNTGILELNITKQKQKIYLEVSDDNGSKNYCSQTKLDFTDNLNIIENHLRVTLYLKTKKRIDMCASNLLKYL